MHASIVDPAAVAASFRAALRTEVATIPTPLTLLGLLAEGHPPSATYAEYTRKGCEDVGICFDLRIVRAEQAERAVRDAGGDPAVHAIHV